jgi:riboflavin synthase
MFTGIIHKTTSVVDLHDHVGGRRLVLAPIGMNHVRGESIAVNGVCLTLAEVHLIGDFLVFDVIPETLDKTNLGHLRRGDVVHVERSLRAGDPIDGHFVQGHVDGTAKLLAQIADETQVRLRLEAPADLARYLIPKGCVAIDGVSLTLAAIDGPQFEVALIPTTLAITTLGKKQAGYCFNLECDSMAKTIISYLERIRPTADHS